LTEVTHNSNEVAQHLKIGANEERKSILFDKDMNQNIA